MSIQSEITRITAARNASFTSIGNKGVTVPSGSTIDDMSGLIDDIDAIKEVSAIPATKDTSIIKLSTNNKYYAWR